MNTDQGTFQVASLALLKSQNDEDESIRFADCTFEFERYRPAIEIKADITVATV